MEKWKNDYSEEFDILRRNRVRVSHYKYGAVKSNYETGLINALGSLKKCLDKYNKTGNTEYLVDAANYLMFEFMYPTHSNAHFNATDSHESAGIDGISIKEFENYIDFNI